MSLSERNHSHPARRVALALALLGFTAVATYNAWLSDDAYITFRSVDNFVNGYGLTWNTAERVQAYTHPLWFFLLAAGSLLSGELYFTSLILSLTVAAVAMFLFGWRLASVTETALFGITLLTLSHAFIDYSTSGLENPLTHLLLVLFLLIYLRYPIGQRRLLLLSLLAALGMLNRMDTALLFLPPLAYAAWQTPAGWLVRLRLLLTGAIPFLLWSLFSLFYYGVIFPNTAYAKLNTGLIRQAELWQQGGYYFANSLAWDPVTLGAVGLAALVVVYRRRVQDWPLLLGMLLYLLYVWRIGGDFMSGRFFAAPLLMAVVLICYQTWTQPRLWLAATAVLMLLIPVGVLHLPLPTPSDGEWLRDDRGVADEKRNYWQSTGLFRGSHDLATPAHGWVQDGLAARSQEVVATGSVGFFGYFAGPDVFVIDVLGLADPLLARLPPGDPSWRIGHFGRYVPDGYPETVVSGINQIEDPDLGRYYDNLLLVVRGPLWQPQRLRAIWHLNWGTYDHYLQRFALSGGSAFTPRYTVTNPTDSPFVYAYVWNNDTAQAYLLSDQSRAGDSYHIEWEITAEGVTLHADYLEQIATIGALDDAGALNVGVFFADTPDRTQYQMFEYRYWFGLDGAEIWVNNQVHGWHNEAAPDGPWQRTDVSAVLKRLANN
jgi:arabinofuranosyltransferase